MTFMIRRCLIGFFTIELIIFVMVYCFGPNSLTTLYDLKQCKEKTIIDIAQLQHDIQLLQSELEQSVTPFAKEKIARERLLMKKPEEIIYLRKS